MNLHWLVIITPKSIVSIRVHCSCCVFCEFSQMYHDIYRPFCIMHNSFTALHDMFLAILNSGISHEISFWKYSIHLICYTVKQKIKISPSALLISGRTLFALFRHAILSGHFLTNSCEQPSGFSCSFTTKLSSLLRWNPRPRLWYSGSAPSTLSFQPISTEGQWWPITHMTSPLSTGSEVSAALPIPPRLMTSFSRRYAEWPSVQAEENGVQESDRVQIS